jgi:hypothetical protein
MNRQVVRRRRWTYLVASGCAVSAALGGLALGHRAATNAGPATSTAVREVPSEWLRDLHPAVACAKAQHKDVLLEFSVPAGNSVTANSRESAVLDTETFRRSVGGAFVLVRMASSRETSPGRLTEITTCAQRLGVARFPTFILLDADAKPYARSELVAADAESYLNEFQRLQQVRVRRDEALALAADAQGTERARLLDRALTAVAAFADSEYNDVERQVIALDPQNAAGLKSKYESAVVSRDLDTVIQNEVYPLVDRSNYRGAIARIDRLIVEIKSPPPQLQLLTAFKGQLYFSLGDKHRAAKFLDDAIAIDPQSESAARARAAKLQLAGIP